MENVFEEVLGNSTPETQEDASSTNDVSALGDEYNLDLEGLDEEVEAEDDSDDDSYDEDDNSYNEDNPTNLAFAQMRTQNKEFSQKLNELDAIAKAAGLKDVDDLITKSKAVQIRNTAKKQGISEEMAQELADFREFKAQYQQDKANQIQQAKEQALVGNLQEFIKDNKLSKSAVDKMSDDLANDGFTIDRLMELPKGALNRIFSSYVGTSTQKNLERKDAIKNELPLNQSSSKIDAQSINKQIDNLAKQFAGKI